MDSHSEFSDRVENTSSNPPNFPFQCEDVVLVLDRLLDLLCKFSSKPTTLSSVIVFVQLDQRGHTLSELRKGIGDKWAQLLVIGL